MKCSIPIFILILLCAPVAGHANLDDAITIQEEEQDGTKIRPPEGKRVYDVDIDSIIRIKIDKEKVATNIPGIRIENSDSEKDRLSQLMRLAQQAKELREDYAQEVSSKTLAEIKQSGSGYLEKASSFWGGIDASFSGPLRDEIDKKIREYYKIYGVDGAETRILALFSEVLADEINIMGERIKKRDLDLPANRFELVAYHASVDGKVSQIAIPPYSKTPRNCVPTEVKRFDLKPNATTKKEMEVVQAAMPLAEDIASGKAKDHFRDLVTEVKGKLKELKAELNEEKIQGLLDDLESAVKKPTASEVDKFKKQIQAAKATLEAVKELTTLSEATPDQVFAKIDELGQLFDQGKSQIVELKKNLEGLHGLLDKVKDDVAANLQKNLTKELEQFQKIVKTDLGELKDNPLVSEVWKLASVIKAQAAIKTSLSKISSQSVGIDQITDTQIDLQSLCGQRKRGDAVKIEATLYGSDEEIIDTASRKVRLQLIGAYAEPHAFLAFVDTRKTVDTTQNYMAAPALGFYLYDGVRNCPVFNELFKPGIGISLSALDFDKNKDLEIGIAVSLVLFQDTMHVGYGRNLQAKANYIYFGLNPLAMWELSQSKSMAP